MPVKYSMCVTSYMLFAATTLAFDREMAFKLCTQCSQRSRLSAPMIGSRHQMNSSSRPNSSLCVL